MGAEREFTHTTTLPAEQTYDAVRRVVADLGYALQGEDRAQGRLVAQTPRSALSWGHLLFLAVEPAADAGSTLRLTVTGVTDAPRALMDGRKNDKAGRRFLEALTPALP